MLEIELTRKRLMRDTDSADTVLRAHRRYGQKNWQSMTSVTTTRLTSPLKKSALVINCISISDVEPIDTVVDCEFCYKARR